MPTVTREIGHMVQNSVAVVKVKSITQNNGCSVVKLDYEKAYWWENYWWSDVSIIRGAPKTLTIYGECGLKTSESYVLGRCSCERRRATGQFLIYHSGCKMYEEPDCHFMKPKDQVTPNEWKLIDKWEFGH
ncbi:hypothetical protein Y032_1033g3448 [Ancylostoma ceylanicum]|uniref:Uncharacterized protein n=1 Tax=Ancylostoma ceylanicum TaxID=53326 RepID=A0A016W990_9BILA|nr:hypothetical protein Y032_1033g3448 [Ancylostoma ceylanicum]